MGAGSTSAAAPAEQTGYGPLCTAFYDLDKPEPAPEALAYYLARARVCGGTVLEPMCGSGRFLLPLLEAGVAVEGQDASLAMLSACQRHARARGLAPVLHAGRLEALALGRRYALAFVPSGSIGLLDAHALQAALACLREHLQPGAPLLLELIVASASSAATSETSLAPRRVQDVDGTSITYACRVRPDAGGQALVYDGCYTRQRDDRVVATECETLRLWLHAPLAMLERLAGVGFEAGAVLPRAYSGLEHSGCVLVEARARR